jgi:hypothetical protein
VRTSRTVEKHGLGACNRHVEGSNLGLSVLKGDVTAMHAALHGRTCCSSRRLGDCVVAIGELELHNVAYGSSDGVWHKRVLRSANDDGYDLAGATEGVSWLVAMC